MPPDRTLREIIEEAHGRASAARHEAFDFPVQVDGLDGAGIYPVLEHRTRVGDDGGGLVTEFTTTLRLLKSDWKYKSPSEFEGLIIRLRSGDAWRPFRVAPDGLADSILTAEWRLRLVAIT